MTLAKETFAAVRAQLVNTAISYSYEELTAILSDDEGIGWSQSTIRDTIALMDILGEIESSRGRPKRFKYNGHMGLPEGPKAIVFEKKEVNHPEIKGEIKDKIKGLIDKRRNSKAKRADGVTERLAMAGPYPDIANAIVEWIEDKHGFVAMRTVLLNAAEVVNDMASKDLDPNDIVGKQ